MELRGAGFSPEAAEPSPRGERTFSSRLLAIQGVKAWRWSEQLRRSTANRARDLGVGSAAAPLALPCFAGRDAGRPEGSKRNGWDQWSAGADGLRRSHRSGRQSRTLGCVGCRALGLGPPRSCVTRPPMTLPTLAHCTSFSLRPRLGRPQTLLGAIHRSAPPPLRRPLPPCNTRSMVQRTLPRPPRWIIP